MANKCQECPPPGAPAWMVTYGDLMTLLLCFFVLLFSFSSMDAIQFESMKESFTGAFGMMQGHFVIDNKGISKQPQKWSSKLFDSALAKIKKAKSDQFPHEQLEYLNSQIEKLEQVIGIFDAQIDLVLGGVESRTYLSPTVKEKTDDSYKKDTQYQDDRSEYLQAKKEDEGEITDDSPVQDFKMPSVSPQKAQMELNFEQQYRNFENEKSELQRLARPDRYLEKKGDASNSQRNPGRNELLSQNSGQNELEDLLTGEDLDKDEKMDIVEGLGQKKRFDYEVPHRIISKVPTLNYSGAFPERLADANRQIQILMEIPVQEIFQHNSIDLLPGKVESLFKEFFDHHYELSPLIYYQIETFTNDYHRSMSMSINLVRQLLLSFSSGSFRQKYELSPSSFAAVGWADCSPTLSRTSVLETEQNAPREWIVVKRVSFK